MPESQAHAWYNNFTNWVAIILVAGVSIGAIVFFTSESALSDGDYSCVSPSSYRAKQLGEASGITAQNNPLEPSWVAEMRAGELYEVSTFWPDREFGTPATATSDFSFGEKIDGSTFSMIADGYPAVCYQ